MQRLCSTFSLDMHFKNCTLSHRSLFPFVNRFIVWLNLCVEINSACAEVKFISVFPIAAIHNWPGNVLHGLELDVGDSVEILEECGPWYRGTCPRKPRMVGIFPKSYIHLKDLAKIDPVVAECTQVLREWSEIWKRLYVVMFNRQSNNDAQNR